VADQQPTQLAALRRLPLPEGSRCGDLQRARIARTPNAPSRNRAGKLRAPQPLIAEGVIGDNSANPFSAAGGPQSKSPRARFSATVHQILQPNLRRASGHRAGHNASTRQPARDIDRRISKGHLGQLRVARGHTPQPHRADGAACPGRSCYPPALGHGSRASSHSAAFTRAHGWPVVAVLATLGLRLAVLERILDGHVWPISRAGDPGCRGRPSRARGPLWSGL